MFWKDFSRLISCVSIRNPDRSRVYKMLSADERAELFVMSQRRQYEVYLRLEYRRSKSISQLIGLTALDRSFMTLLATQYAFFRMGLVDTYLPASFTTSTDQILPLDRVIFIETDYTERQRRWCLRNTDHTVQIYIDEHFNFLFREFFIRLATHIPILFLSSDIHSPDDIAERVMRFVDDCHDSKSVTFNSVLELNLS